MVKPIAQIIEAENETSRTMVLRNLELAEAEIEAALPSLRRIKISKPR